MKRHQQTAGFSLIEVLVAMTLLSLIGVMAGGAVSFGRTVWDRTEERGNSLAETRAVQSFLRRQLEHARVVQLRNGSRTPPVFFEGTRTSVEFIAPITAVAAPHGEHLVRLARSDLAEGRSLELSFDRIGTRRPTLSSAAIIEPLLFGVRDLNLRYFGAASDGGEAVWQSEWRNRPDLPGMIEVELTFMDTRRSWPRFVVALPAQRSARTSG